MSGRLKVVGRGSVGLQAPCSEALEVKLESKLKQHG